MLTFIQHCNANSQNHMHEHQATLADAAADTRTASRLQDKKLPLTLAPPRAHSTNQPTHAYARQRARNPTSPKRARPRTQPMHAHTHTLLARTQPAADGHEPWSSTSRLVAGLLPSAFDMQVQGCSGRKSGRTSAYRDAPVGASVGASEGWPPFTWAHQRWPLGMRPWPPFSCAPCAWHPRGHPFHVRRAPGRTKCIQRCARGHPLHVHGPTKSNVSKFFSSLL